MRNWAGIAVAITMASLAVDAHAQTVATPDPVRFALARDVLKEQGVARQYEARIKSGLSIQIELIKQIAPADQESLATAMFSYMAEEELKAVPSMLDDAAKVYAENLSETELRDILAWSESPSGVAFYAKVPAINHELLLRQVPLMKNLIGGAMRKAVERTCAEKPCTPEQRQVLTNIGDKLLNGAS